MLVFVWPKIGVVRGASVVDRGARVVVGQMVL